MKLPISTKHLQISKANNMTLIVIAAAAIISVFSLVSAKALLSQSAYQRKVISQRQKAVDQLKKNIVAAKELSAQYQVFANADPNLIGGKGGDLPGEGPQDGDNPRLVLDALPSQYDFPALLSSIEKIVTNASLKPQTLSGTDEGQDSNPSQASPTSSPQPAEMAFTIELISSYGGLQNLVKDFERSIRPINVTNIELSGADAAMTMSIQAKTYFQPAKTVSIQEKVVK